VAATVEADDAEVLLEICADRVEELVAVAEAAMQEHDGALTASASVDPRVEAVDIDVRHDVSLLAWATPDAIA
jgi:hypothetical protein